MRSRAAPPLAPDGRCLDCGFECDLPEPHYGGLLFWTCPECGGRLEIEMTCKSCTETNGRKTGWLGLYGRLRDPDDCDHCEAGELLIRRTPPPHKRQRSDEGFGRWRLLLAVVLFLAFTAQLGAFVGGFGAFMLLVALGHNPRGSLGLLAILALVGGGFGARQTFHHVLGHHFAPETLAPERGETTDA